MGGQGRYLREYMSTSGLGQKGVVAMSYTHVVTFTTYVMVHLQSYCYDTLVHSAHVMVIERIKYCLPPMVDLVFIF